MFILESNNNAKTNFMSVNCFIDWLTEVKVMFDVKCTSLLLTVGNCSCEVGFGGSDCSFDILSPPVIWESTPTGTCDKSLHQCSRIYFNGRYFHQTICKFQLRSYVLLFTLKAYIFYLYYNVIFALIFFNDRCHKNSNAL